MRILAPSFLSLTTVKREASSAKIFALDCDSFGKLLSIKPWGTLAKTGHHEDVYPFKITLCNLPER